MSSRGKITDAQDSIKVKQSGSGSISQLVKTNQIGYLLLNTLGTVSSEEDSTGAYIHTFTLNNSNTTQSLTM